MKGIENALFENFCKGQENLSASGLVLVGNIQEEGEKKRALFYTSTPRKDKAAQRIFSKIPINSEPPKKLIVLSTNYEKCSSRVEIEAENGKTNTSRDKKSHTSVFVRVDWECRSKERCLPQDLVPLGKMLCRGTYKQIAHAAWRCPALRDHLTENIVRQIDKECSQLCAKGSTKKPIQRSILQLTSKEDVMNFSFQKLASELEQHSPLFWAVLKAATLKRQNDPSKDMHWLQATCMAASVCLKNRNTKMTAVQLIITIVVQHSGFMKLDEFGENHDQLLRNQQYKQCLDRKIIIDNFDFRTNVHEMTQDHQNAGQQYISAKRASDTEKKLCGSLQQNCLSASFRKFLGFIYANSNEASGMQEVLIGLHDSCVPCSTLSSETCYSHIGIVGDQGSVERGVNVWLQLSDGFDSKERLGGIHMEIADFHAGMKFLQYGYDKFYNSKAASDKCTMYADRNVINQRNVTSDVSKRVDACKKFFILEVTARIIAAFLEVLQIKDINEYPSEDFLPHDACDGPPRMKKQFLEQLSSKVVDMYVLRQSHFTDILQKQRYQDWLKTTNKKTEDGLYLCRQVGCGKTFHADGKRRLDHEKMHNLHSELTKIKNKADSVDEMFNYQLALLDYGLLTLNFFDAVSEGDGMRVLRCWKYMLPRLRNDGQRSQKYALEALYVFCQIHVLLP
eukprot:gene968-282_t